MAGADGDGPEQPLFEPRVVEFLKDRPRLVDKGLREEFLDQLARNMRERRKPDTMAENVARDMMRRLEDAGGGVVKQRTRNALQRANEGPMERF